MLQPFWVTTLYTLLLLLSARRTGSLQGRGGPLCHCRRESRCGSAGHFLSAAITILACHYTTDLWFWPRPGVQAQDGDEAKTPPVVRKLAASLGIASIATEAEGDDVGPRHDKAPQQQLQKQQAHTPAEVRGSAAGACLLQV